jgi:hypothetical protein
MIRIARLVGIVTIQKKVCWGTSWGTLKVYFRDESRKKYLCLVSVVHRVK